MKGSEEAGEMRQLVGLKAVVRSLIFFFLNAESLKNFNSWKGALLN